LYLPVRVFFNAVGVAVRECYRQRTLSALFIILCHLCNYFCLFGAFYQVVVLRRDADAEKVVGEFAQLDISNEFIGNLPFHFIVGWVDIIVVFV
jgi:hypothetical protein